VRSVPTKAQLGETGNVLMKVNEQLFDMAFDLSEAGIPVFAGVPVVSSLVQLAQTFECNWYSLIASQGGFADSRSNATAARTSRTQQCEGRSDRTRCWVSLKRGQGGKMGGND